MVEDVHVGDNVVVKCDVATNEDYQILLCDKGLHMIQHGFKDVGAKIGPMRLGHPRRVVSKTMIR